MNQRESFATDLPITITIQDGVRISKITLYFLAGLFLCSNIAVGFLVYNFTSFKPNAENSYEINANSNVNELNPYYINNKNRTFQENHFLKNKTIENITDNNVRLPRSLIPIGYDIRLIPFLFDGNFTFHGIVKMKINVKENCKNITLHAVDLKIHPNDVKVSLQLDPKNEKKELSIRKQQFVETKQFFIIFLNDELIKGSTVEVLIKYSGCLQDYLHGFYRSSYMVGNEKRWIAATQFQPTDARRAFPCFDEPALKAKFNITIARPKNMTSLSNMPKLMESSEPVLDIPEYVWDVYEESVPMSTYLVAFVVCDFVNQSNGNFSVWTRSDAISSAEFALKFGPKVLDFLEDFFNISYPLSKMDMIALPDFQAGAMENWGLITFRETAMLYESGISPITNLQRIATVVAHELAHQWFGNLVTPSWWSDIWLNEGFATYMEYLCVEAIKPNWKSMEQFIINELQNVFNLDVLSSSHKISVQVENPDQIDEIFDRISYAKGSTIIRMMKHFLTSKVFRQGLGNYLKEMAYKAADQNDLWRFLTAEAHKENSLNNYMSVKEIMETWTLQKGFPVVHIKPGKIFDSLELNQERFTYSRKIYKESNKNLLWWIPITYTTSDSLNFTNTKPSHWMEKTKTLIITNSNTYTSDWILLNIQQTGYYRVNYNDKNWIAITKHLLNIKKFKEISTSNRAQLIDDSLNLARGGYLSYDIALNLTQYLIHEDEYAPWKSFISAFSFLDRMLIKEGDYHLFKTYLLHLIKPLYKNLNFDEFENKSDLLTAFKRSDILSAACHIGHTDCVSKCSLQFHNWMIIPSPDTNNPISPNLKNLIYCTAIRYGTETEWDFAYERFLHTTVSSEKETLLHALGCSREPWILNRYLKRAFSNDAIRKQDLFRVFAAISNNIVGQPIAFNYIKKHCKEIQNYLGSSSANLNSIIKYVTQPLNTRFELDELQRFVEIYNKSSSRLIRQAIERVQDNIIWMDRNYDTIIAWLKMISVNE